MLNYIVAIPSSNRSEILKKRTLTFLRNHNIDNFKIYVFVDKTEIETYRMALSQFKGINIIEGLKGCKENRMAISRYFPEETPILSLDDDVKDIIDINGCPIKSLHYLVSDSINFMLSNQIKMMGILPTKNPFFMKNHISRDLKFIIGQFRIFFNKKYCENREYNLLEDYETTLNYYKYGGTARWENVGIDADYNKLPGGIKEQRTIEKKKEEVERFKLQYPEYCRVKKEGMEIQLIKSPKRKEVFSLWVSKDGKLPAIQQLALKSWLRQNLKVTLYTNLKTLGNSLDTYIKSNRIILKNYNEILHYDDEDEICPYSDEFRFKVLYENGGCWLDMDLVLLKEIPNDDIIISSEHSFVKGAYKSKLPFKPNIGLLKFPPKNIVLKETLERIEKLKSICIAQTRDNMKLFTSVLKKPKHEDIFKFVAEPWEYCPVPFWNFTEIYQDINDYKIKYGVENVLKKDEILGQSIGVHIWNHFTTGNKISLDDAHQNSLYGLLVSRINY